MYGKGKRKGTIRFALQAGEGVREVDLVGDFSDWRPVRMKRQAGGVFVRHVPAPPGAFEYKFVVDGKWVSDPDNPFLSPDPFGTFNSVVPNKKRSPLAL